MSSCRVQLRCHTRTTTDLFFLIPIPCATADLELKIPCADVSLFSTAPVRWLLLIGYGTLGILGHIVDVDSPGIPLALDSQTLYLGHIYRYSVFADVEMASLHILNIPDSINEAAHSQTSDSSSSASSQDPDPKARIARSPAHILRAVSTRNAGRCVFGKAYDDETSISHIMSPENAIRDPHLSLRLAAARGFAFSHHLDVRNMITLDMRIRSCWHDRKVFILAVRQSTDSRFLRDGDIAQPTGPILDASRAALSLPSSTAYILQMSPEVLSRPFGILNTHRHNERAVFSGAGNGDDSNLPRPDAEALHCVYAGGMLARYVHARQRPLVVVRDSEPEREPDEEIGSASQGGSPRIDCTPPAVDA